MSFIASLIYGLFCGLTEFLPVSSQGHRVLLREVLGITNYDPLFELLIHIAVFLSLLVSCGTYIVKLRREYKQVSRGRKKHNRRMEYDLRLIRTAAVPALIGAVLIGIWGHKVSSLIMTALFFCINGIIIYLPDHSPQGNKDSSKLSLLHSVLIGAGVSSSFFSGISAIGAGLSAAITAKADKNKALEWIYIICIPMLFVFIIFDIIGMFTYGIAVTSFGQVMGYLLGAFMSFVSGVFGIYLMRFFCSRSAVSIFAYYSWGVALLSFILFLMA